MDDYFDLDQYFASTPYNDIKNSGVDGKSLTAKTGTQRGN